MDYEHTQKAPLNWVLLASAAFCVVIGLSVSGQPPAMAISFGVAGLIGLLSFCCGTLTVRGNEDRLSVRFGPIALFGITIKIAEVRKAEACRSTFVDGWGIHWTPGRGWIYNLWGFDCVRIETDKKTIRIGTDDVDGLVAFLSETLKRAQR